MPTSKSAPISARSARIFIVAVCLAIWLALTLLVTKGSFPTPYLDEYRFWRIYAGAKEGSIEFSDVFALHNGAHLYVLLKLWLWGVVRLGLDWRISMHIQAALIAVMAGMALKYGMGARPTFFSCLMGLTAALALSSARQNENLYWAMQVSAAAMLLASMLSFYYVERLHETQKTKHAIIALFFAAVALLSSGGGFVTAAVTIMAVFLVSKKRRLKIALFSTVAAAIATWFMLIPPFFLGYGVDAASGSNALPILKKIALYFPQFFSNALYAASRSADDATSIATGCAVLAFAAGTHFSTPRHHHSLFPFLLICFALASCAAIAPTRIKLLDPAAPRYYPFAATLLAGVALYLRQPQNMRQKIMALLLFASVSVSFAHSYGTEFKAAPGRKEWQRAAHLHLCAKVEKSSHPALEWIADAPEHPAYSDLDFMRSIFCRAKDMQWLKNHIPALKEIGPQGTQQGEAFNPQEDGASALWAFVENCDTTCTLVFDGKPLPTRAHKNGALLTATVPPQLYAEPGEKRIYALDTRSGAKSGLLIFTVSAKGSAP